MTELSPEDAAALVRAVAARRDREAFSLLYRFYAPRVRGWLVKGGADIAQADEILNEVMLTVWRKAESYDPARASVSTWVFTIARNRRIDRLRRESRPEPDPDDPLYVPSAPPPPDEALGELRQATRLQEALQALPEEQAAVLHGAYFQGRTLQALAEERSVPLGTVKSRVRLALGTLRRLLGAEQAP